MTSPIPANRPEYLSYLPPAYVDSPDGVFAGLVRLFEALMADSSDLLRRLPGSQEAEFESWAALDILPHGIVFPPALAGLIRYDETECRLVYSGVMSAAEKTVLLGLALDANYHHAIEQLYQRSQGEPIHGIEQLLDRIDCYSDPLWAPIPVTDSGWSWAEGFFDDDFISYLASWVALGLKQRWPETKKRRLIQNIVPLYKRRGTYEGIVEFLKIFVESPVVVHEELGIQVGERATVGVDTRVGGLPHQFKVEIIYGYREIGDTAAKRFDTEFLRFVTENTVEILELEKPAHTHYQAVYNFPGIVVGDYSTVGWDTLVWTRSKPLSLTT